MKLGLDGKRAVVLGASKGIGRGIANALAQEGARVVLASRSRESAEEAAQSIGREAKGYACDTGQLDQVDALFEQATRDLGGVDIVLLNSGGPPAGPAAGVSSETWQRWFNAMFVGLVRMADHALPGMIERRWGRIVNVISSGVIQPIPNLGISNTIRPALIGWAKSVSNEVAAHGVTVNSIAPGRIETERLGELDAANAKRQGRSVEEVARESKARIPMGRYGTVDEFAAAAVFLMSDAASYITGSIIRVDGGQISSI
jgi:3-oxoacyl-[acyl-carrier protein] reductase